MRKSYLVLAMLFVLAYPIFLPASVSAQVPDNVIVSWSEFASSNDLSGSGTNDGVTIIWDIGDGYANATMSGTSLSFASNAYIRVSWAVAPDPLPLGFNVDTRTNSSYTLRVQSYAGDYDWQTWHPTEDINWGFEIPGGDIMYVYFGLDEDDVGHDITFAVEWGGSVTPAKNSSFGSIKALYR